MQPDVDGANGAPPSHLRALVRLGLQRLRSGARPAVSSPVPKRRLAVERRGIPIDPRRVARFLEVTGGERVARFQGADAVLPPTFPAVWETALALELLGRMDEPLPVAGLIHRESELVQIRPLQVQDRVRCRVELDRADPHPKGVQLTLAGRSWNAAGQLCSQSTMVLLARTPPAGDTSRQNRNRPSVVESATGADASGEWREVTRWRMRSDHGRRYARVSGDFNPIHLWPWTARWFGFKRPILHGFCTGAMVAHALIERLLGGDPAALRRLHIGFRRPLLLPASVRLSVREQEGGGQFRVEVEGKRAVAEGTFVGSMRG
jgi:acyl dehydratase